MKRLFTYFLLIITVLFCIVFAVGYYFGLWQGSLFKQNRALEVRLIFPKDNLEFARELFKQNRGFTIETYALQPSKILIDRSKTDLAGLHQNYLKAGKYELTINNKVLTEKGLYNIFSNPLDITLKDKDVSLKLPVKIGEETNAGELLDYFKKLLKDGNLADARKLSDLITIHAGKNDAGALEEANRAKKLMSNIEENLEIINVTPRTSYISRIEGYKTIANKLRAFLGVSEDTPLKITSNGRPFVLQERIVLLEDRSEIIASHIDDFERFYEIRRYSKALEQWQYIITDPQLYREDFPLKKQLQKRLDSFKNNVKTAESKVKGYLQFRITKSIGLYEQSKLAEALQSFKDVKARSRTLKATVKLKPENMRLINSYSMDIISFRRGNNAYDSDDYENARKYYSKVVHPNVLLKERLTRLKELGELHVIQ